MVCRASLHGEPSAACGSLGQRPMQNQTASVRSAKPQEPPSSPPRSGFVQLVAGANSRWPFCLRRHWEIRCSLASSRLSLRRLRLSSAFCKPGATSGGTTSVIGSGKNQPWGTVACVSADRKGGPGTGKPDPPKYTTCSGQPHPKNPRYSGFPGVFGVNCLRLQRLASSVGLGTGTPMAPRKNLRTGPETGVSACKHGGSGSSNRFCPPIQMNRSCGVRPRSWLLRRSTRPQAAPGYCSRGTVCWNRRPSARKVMSSCSGPRGSTLSSAGSSGWATMR